MARLLAVGGAERRFHFSLGGPNEVPGANTSRFPGIYAVRPYPESVLLQPSIGARGAAPYS